MSGERGKRERRLQRNDADQTELFAFPDRINTSSSLSSPQRMDENEPVDESVAIRASACLAVAVAALGDGQQVERAAAARGGDDAPSRKRQIDGRSTAAASLRPGAAAGAASSDAHRQACLRYSGSSSPTSKGRE